MITPGADLEALSFKRLTASTGPKTKAAIDRVLKQARRELVRGDEALASADERALDADGDTQRIVVYARTDQRTVAVADATLHTPAPADVTVSQIAVAKEARGRGVGRALVLEVLRRAERRIGPLGAVYASVLSGNHRAVEFWETMGMEIVERDRRTTLLRGASESIAREREVKR